MIKDDGMEGKKSRFGLGAILGLGCGGIVLIGIVLAVIGVMMYFQYDGQEIGLRNAIKAQQKSNEVSFDNTWKILQQQASIKDDYKESFRDIFVSLMQERHYEQGGSFMKWITEKNPKFDISLFKKLMDSIAVERKTFERNQNKLLSLKQEHDDVRTKAPSRFFVGGRPEVEVKIVTSTKTEKTFETGKEDDIDLSPKKPQGVEKK